MFRLQQEHSEFVTVQLFDKKNVTVLPAPVLLLDVPRRACLFLKMFAVVKNKNSEGKRRRHRPNEKTTLPVLPLACVTWLVKRHCTQLAVSVYYTLVTKYRCDITMRESLADAMIYNSAAVKKGIPRSARTVVGVLGANRGRCSSERRERFIQRDTTLFVKHNTPSNASK